jgi:hypothetical protein
MMKPMKASALMRGGWYWDLQLSRDGERAHGVLRSSGEYGKDQCHGESQQLELGEDRLVLIQVVLWFEMGKKK